MLKSYEVIVDSSSYSYLFIISVNYDYKFLNFTGFISTPYFIDILRVNGSIS